MSTCSKGDHDSRGCKNWVFENFKHNDSASTICWGGLLFGFVSIHADLY